MKKILVLSAFALIAFGCSRTSEVSNTGNVNAPAANTTQANVAAESQPVKDDVFTAGENPKGDVFYSTKKQMSAPVWSATMTSETTPEMNMLMEHVAPNRYYVKQPQGEVIVIGRDSYINRGGQWEKAGIDLSGMLNSQAKLVTEEALNGIKDAQKVGEEKFKGKDAIIYSYKTEGEEEGESAATKVWIDKSTGLPLRIDVEGKVNGQTQKVSSVYDYDKKVIIEAPKVN